MELRWRMQLETAAALTTTTATPTTTTATPTTTTATPTTTTATPTTTTATPTTTTTAPQPPTPQPTAVPITLSPETPPPLAVEAEYTVTEDECTYSYKNYWCARELRCVPFENICDSVGDCDDGTDESSCTGWQQTETGYYFNRGLVGNRAETNVSTVADCKRYSILYNGLAFAFNQNTRTCVVYTQRARVLDALDQPESFLVPAEDFVLYIHVTNPDLYRHCSAELHCTGHGDLVYINSNSSGNTCPCRCHQGWLGHRCNIAFELSTVISYLAIIEKPTGKSRWSKGIFQSVMSLNKSDIVITSDFPERFNETHYTVPFSATGGVVAVTGFGQRIFRQNEWPPISERLAYLLMPKLAFVSGMSTPVQSRQASCGVTAEGETTCAPDETIESKTTRFRITADSSLGAFKVLYKYLSDGTTRRRQTDTTTTQTGTITCDSSNMAVTSQSSKCERAVCSLPLDEPATVTDITVVPDDSTKTNDDSCGYISVNQVKSSEYLNASKDTTQTATYDPRNDNVLNYGFAAICLFVLVLILSFVFARITYGRTEKKVEELYREAVGEKQEERPHWTVLVAARELYLKTLKFDWVHVHLVVGLVCFVFIVTGAYALVQYYSAVGLASNVDVVLEQYLDQECDQSSYAYVPTVVSKLSGDQICQFMTSAGSDATRLYTRGTCYRDEAGQGYAELVVTETYALCTDSPVIRVPLETCVPKDILFSDNSKSQYIRVRCLGTDVSTKLLTSLAELSPLPVFNSTLPVTTFSTRITAPTKNGDVYEYPMLWDGAVKTSSTHRANRIAAMATKERYIGQYNRYGLIYQTRSSLTASPSTALAKQIETVWGANQSTFDAAGVLATYLPADPDWPVGFVFNFYNTVDEVRGAYPFTAQKYPYMKNSPFDLGTVFGDEQSNDGQGATISFWLRASSRSEGFVFALTDYVENINSGENPILNMAKLILETGRDSRTSWFSKDFHIYYALYLDGPSRILRLILADPQSEISDGAQQPIRTVEWRLADIEFGNILLNDQWHQVRIMFTNLNSKVMVQLAVDGSTSYGNNGWTHCLGVKRMTSIVTLPDTVTGSDATNEAVYQGGLMTIGYFNGGVAMLEVEDYPIPRGSLKANGVAVLRDVASFGSTDVEVFSAIGHVLTSFAFLLLIGACLTSYSVYKLWMMENKALSEIAEAPYTNVLWSSRFRKSTGYNPLPFAEALALMEVDAKEFMALMEEINSTTGSARKTLVRILWCAYKAKGSKGGQDTDLDSIVPTSAHESSPVSVKIGNKVFPIVGPIEGVAMPSAEEWNDMVDELAPEGAKVSAPSFVLSTAPSASFNPAVSSGVQEYTEIEEFTKPKRVARLLLTPSIGNLIEGSTHVLQGVAVYAAVTQFPLNYRLSWAKLFEFIGLDWSVAFSMPQTVTPILQCFASVVFVIIVVYLAVMDDRRFLFSLSKFTRIRDLHDATSKEEQDQIRARLLGLETCFSLPTEMVVLVQLVDPLDRLRVNRFCNALDNRDRAVVNPDMEETLNITLSDGAAATLHRKSVGEVVMRVEDKPYDVNQLTVFCPTHGRILTATNQNDVYPFVNRRTCSAVECSQPCNRNMGTVYVCNKRHKDPDTGLETCCNFALCERHWAPTSIQSFRSRLQGIVFMIEEYGFSYFLAKIFVVVLISLYTPFMRTVLMVISCHPFYQCALGSCWKRVTPDFAISAYVTIVTLIIFGVGVPLFTIITLVRRYTYLRKAFRLRDVESPYRDENGHIDVIQWCRFLTSDDSAMSALYNQLLPSRMAYLPVFLAFKFALLCPAIFIEPNTAGQLIGIAVLEICFGLFTLGTSPYISPWIDLLNRVGCAHQLITLALLSYYSVEEVGGKTLGIDAGSFMIFFTSLYIAFCACYFFSIIFKPTVEGRLWTERRRRLLYKFGLPPAAFSPLFLSGVDGNELIKAEPSVKNAAVLEDKDIKDVKKKAVRSLKRAALSIMAGVRMRVLSGTLGSLGSAAVSTEGEKSPAKKKKVSRQDEDGEEDMPMGMQFTLSTSTLWGGNKEWAWGGKVVESEGEYEEEEEEVPQKESDKDHGGAFRRKTSSVIGDKPLSHSEEKLSSNEDFEDWAPTSEELAAAGEGEEPQAQAQVVNPMASPTEEESESAKPADAPVAQEEEETPQPVEEEPSQAEPAASEQPANPLAAPSAEEPQE